MSPTDFDPIFPIAAAIVDDGSVNMDNFLAGIVREQQAIGRRIRGCLMKRPPRQEGCASTMVLVDIDTADEYLVSQPMGAQSKACRADPQGFARASQVLRLALTQSPDLVVSNRFGDLEVLRGGFSAELLAIMENEVPLLTTVALRNVAAWKEFTGGGHLLSPELSAITAWIDGALAHRMAATTL